MLLDLSLLYPEERQSYLDLGRRYDPAVALAQADSTMRAFAGSMRELMEQGFLFEDQMALLAARNQLDELYHGRNEGPVDPDDVPILAGMVITLAREAEKAAREAARVAYHASRSELDLLIVHWFKVAPPKEGCEPPLRKTGSLQEHMDLEAEDERQARELRDLRRAREREGWKWQQSKTAPTPGEAPKAPPYRAPPAGRKAAPKKERDRPSGPTPEQIVWKEAVDACKKERSEHGRSALTSAGLLALGLAGLLLAAQADSEGHTQANSRLAAGGVLLTLTAFFGLTRALIRLVVVSRRLTALEAREPVDRR